jgi:LCP family protein required for cell wall assembly
VAELRPPAVETAVEDEPSPHARAEHQRDQRAGAPPRAEPPLGQRRGVAVVLDAHGKAEGVRRPLEDGDVVEREVGGAVGEPGVRVEVAGQSQPDARGVAVAKLLHGICDRLEERLLGRGRADPLDLAVATAFPVDEPGEDLRPADVDCDDAVTRHAAATISSRMPADDKPYRLYRGGRSKGRVPLQRHLTPPKERASADPGPPSAPTGRPPRRRRVGRWIALSAAVLAVLLVVWGVAGYLSFRSGVQEANARIPSSASALLASQDGLLTSTPTTILVLGTDGASTGGRADANRTDSIMLLRTDPRRHRLAFLSIPRDLRVEIPDVGTGKINAAYQYGGASLALRTVRELTGIPVNHVAVVDFDRFRELIDAVGGIDVVVREPILSKRFDCPYATAERCAQWEGWRFERGRQHMDGRRALVYARIRTNQLDPSETDLDRARRQQQVLQATADKLSSVGTALRMPFIGGDVVRPLATDLSAGQLLQLGWAYFRADSSQALHCRLGGDPASIGGESVILGSEDNVAALAMFTGKSAPLPPPKGLPYAPGCVVGDRDL